MGKKQIIKNKKKRVGHHLCLDSLPWEEKYLVSESKSGLWTLQRGQTRWEGWAAGRLPGLSLKHVFKRKSQLTQVCIPYSEI